MGQSATGYLKVSADIQVARGEDGGEHVAALPSTPHAGAAAFTAANGRIDSVQPNRYFKPVLTGLLVLHGLVLAVMLRQAARHTRVSLLIKPALLLLIITTGFVSSLPGLRLIVLPVAAQIAQVSELEVSQVLGLFLKSGHAVLYMVLTLALAPVQRALQITLLHYALFLLIMAAGSESLQLFVTDRQAALTGVAIDASGILVGLLILSLWRRRLDYHAD